jgi:rubrerythrin
MDDILKRNEKLNEGVPSNEEQVIPAEQLTPEDLDSRWLRWKCLVCGYLYEGVNRIKVCPKCGNEDPDKFDDAD